MRIKPQKGLFKIFNTISIIAVYFLILVGGIVRSTGPGMGCPDWPKCFGSYLPPTSESQLPEDFQAIYSHQISIKSDRLATMLTMVGFDGMAKEVMHNANAQQEQGFSTRHTWIEYVYRWLGVIVGLLIFISTVLSVQYLQNGKRIVLLSVLTFLLYGFQGWFDSQLLATRIVPGTITLHLLLLIGLISLLIYVRFYVGKENLEGELSHKPYKVRRLLTLCMMLFFAQLLLGSQVREAIDSISFHLGVTDRVDWVDSLGMIFNIHRSFSILLLLIHVYLVFRLVKSIENFKLCKYLVWSLLICIVLETLVGGVLANFGLPYFIQPIHLILAFVIFGIQYSLYLMIKEKEKISEQIAYEK